MHFAELADCKFVLDVQYYDLGEVDTDVECDAEHGALLRRKPTPKGRLDGFTQRWVSYRELWA